MNHLERATTFLHGALSFLIKGVRELWKTAMERKLTSAAILVAVIAVLVVVPGIVFKKKEPQKSDERRGVTLITVADVSGPEPVSLIGEVRSKREASVASDIPGTVSRVYRSLGDVVGAGTIIAELKNDSQRATVAQANAALEKAKSGTTVGTLSLGTAEAAFNASQDSAANAIENAYSTVEDAITRKADQMFSNPTGSQPKFNVVTSNSQLVYTVENKRLAMGAILARHAANAVPTKADTELIELARLSTEAAQVSDFLSDIASALSGAIPANGISDGQIAAFRADVSGALSAVNGIRSALTGSTQDLKSKQAAVDIAREGILPGATGVSADIAGAEANLAAAEAQLEKTLIRAPISGTINRLDLSIGEFVNASVPVVYISNSDGLEIVAFVSDRDIRDITLGAEVTIGGSVKGRVSKAASALDPVTKKAEVRISVPDSANLISGSSATLSIQRIRREENGVLQTLAVPLSAVKITPEGSQVFTLDASSALVSHTVTLGTLSGSKVEITSGLTPEMRIVKDARGLKEGQSVLVEGN